MIFQAIRISDDFKSGGDFLGPHESASQGDREPIDATLTIFMSCKAQDPAMRSILPHCIVFSACLSGFVTHTCKLPPRVWCDSDYQSMAASTRC